MRLRGVSGRRRIVAAMARTEQDRVGESDAHQVLSADSYLIKKSGISVCDRFLDWCLELLDVRGKMVFFFFVLALC